MAFASLSRHNGHLSKKNRESSQPCQVGARFFAPAQNGPGAHPASYKMGTVSFPGVQRPGRGVDHPPSSAEFKERVQLYLYFPSGPSWPVLGRPLPLPLPLYIKMYICFHIIHKYYMWGLGNANVFLKFLNGMFAEETTAGDELNSW
jgi:hypothetical protein